MGIYIYFGGERVGSERRLWGLGKVQGVGGSEKEGGGVKAGGRGGEGIREL